MNKYQVHYPPELKPLPTNLETSAAYLIADFLQRDVTFVRPNYRTHAADLIFDGGYLEIKSPIGNSGSTIKNILRKAKRQASIVVLDLRRCKMDINQAIHRAKFAWIQFPDIKRLLVITKTNKVIEL